MKSTLKEYEEILNKGRNESKMANQNTYDLKFRLTKDLRLQLLEVIKNRTDKLYHKLYMLTIVLPTSLKQELIKNEIFELNNKICNSQGPYLKFEEDDLSGLFFEHYLYAFMPKEIEFDLGLQPLKIIGTDEEVFKYFPNIKEIIDKLCDQLHFKNLIQCYEDLEKGNEMATPNIILQLHTKLTNHQLEKMYDLLVANGFVAENEIDNFVWAFGGKELQPENWKPITWIKTNSTTHNKYLNKKSLLNLLQILGIRYIEIMNRALLNKLFNKPDGKSIRFTASNYSKGFKSEYDIKLFEIVELTK